MATKLLQDLVKGDTSRAEGIKMSKELAQHFIDWIRTSPFGKKNGNLPLDMLIKASFNWGIERGLDSSLKSELADLKDSVKEALVFEGAVKQFEIDYKDMETSIKRGIGWIDPEYVEDTWENSSDAIDFELVKGEIYNRLLKAGLLWYSDEDGEEKGKQVKSLKELGIKESLVNEAKNDFVAKHSGTNINLKNGYKNHNEEELTKLYNKIGELLKDELSVKDVTVVFESKVNEAEIKSDDEFKEYAMTVLKKAFGADFDEAKAEEVADGILKKCDGDYGACVGMLTSSLGESVTNEAKEFSFIFNYNTDEDDVAYIQNILKKAGVNATAEAGLDSEEMEVKAANAIELRKAKKAIEADGFEINEASRRATDFYGDSKYGKSIDLLLKGKWDSKKVENFLDKLGDGNDVKYARIIDFISGDAGLNIRKYKNIGEQLPDLMKQLEVLYKDFLTESVNEAQKINPTSKKFLKGMKTIKVNGLGGYMPGVDYVYVDGNKYYFVDFEGDYMELKNTDTIKQLHKLHGRMFGESVNEANIAFVNDKLVGDRIQKSGLLPLLGDNNASLNANKVKFTRELGDTLIKLYKKYSSLPIK